MSVRITTVRTLSRELFTAYFAGSVEGRPFSAYRGLKRRAGRDRCRVVVAYAETDADADAIRQALA